MTLTVVGQTGSARVAALAGPKVATTGPLADLSGAYDAARVFVAPIRAAAGSRISCIMRRHTECLSCVRN